MTRQNNLTKYNFKNLKKGETFTIEKEKVISCKNSLRSYNKAHGLTIEITYEPSETPNDVLVTCTKAAVAESAAPATV